MNARPFVHPLGSALRHGLLLSVLLPCLTAAQPMTPAAATQATAANALDLQFSCSQSEGEGEDKVIYADFGAVRIVQGQLQELRWESGLHRRTHGFDCSITQEDGVELDTLEGGGWRIRLRDSAAARSARGYDTERGRLCSIRILPAGDGWQIVPSCAALCGSRANFSALTVYPAQQRCRYD